MKPIITFLTILFISLMSSPSWSEPLTIDDLVERNNLFYKKFTDVPFSGEVSGIEKGSFQKGKKKGEWLTFFDSGQLSSKGNFKDGKQEGLWEYFNEDGSIKKTENYKDGELVE